MRSRSFLKHALLTAAWAAAATGSGLVAKDGTLANFVIAGADRKFVPAKAVIDGKTVMVSSDTVAEPVAVRYAFDNAGVPSLFNREGLPAAAFRTDEWQPAQQK